jgi:hypothetical protein
LPLSRGCQVVERGSGRCPAHGRSSRPRQAKSWLASGLRRGRNTFAFLLQALHLSSSPTATISAALGSRSAPVSGLHLARPERTPSGSAATSGSPVQRQIRIGRRTEVISKTLRLKMRSGILAQTVRSVAWEDSNLPLGGLVRRSRLATASFDPRHRDACGRECVMRVTVKCSARATPIGCQDPCPHHFPRRKRETGGALRHPRSVEQLRSREDQLQ